MLLDELNEQQRVAAAQCEGAVMIVAGAGSGKTRTLTYGWLTFWNVVRRLILFWF